MSVVLIAILGTLFGAAALKTMEHRMSRKGTKAISSKPPLEYDVNYTRQKEMEIWGYYFTPAPEAKAVSAAASTEQLQTRTPTYAGECYRCGVKVASGRDTCQRCTMSVLAERGEERARKLREYHAKQIHRTARVPRTRSVDGYSIRIPDSVPDNAFASTEYNPGSDLIKVYWKWTDTQTGKANILMSLVSPEMLERNVGERYRNNPCSDRAGHELATCDCEEYVVESGDGKVIKNFYA